MRRYGSLINTNTSAPLSLIINLAKLFPFEWQYELIRKHLQNDSSFLRSNDISKISKLFSCNDRNLIAFHFTNYCFPSIIFEEIDTAATIENTGSSITGFDVPNLEFSTFKLSLYFAATPRLLKMVASGK